MKANSGSVLLRLVVCCVFVVLGSGAGFGQIVITEIIQNPSAVGDGAGEWFELHNAGSSAVDIDGWKIKDDSSAQETHTISKQGGLSIPAGGYIVLALNADSNANGGVTAAYTYSRISLGNSTDGLVLTDGSDVEQDRVVWDNGSTFPDPNGASMALMTDMNGNYLDNSVGANWCESQNTWPGSAGDSGTPGAANDCMSGPTTFSGAIYEIQGSGGGSPELGALATTENNVVTAVGAGGFFIQTPTANSDNDADTSDGIFVLYDGTLMIEVGDQVDVTGTVEEFFGFTRLDATVDDASVTVDASNQPLPAPVEFGAGIPSPDPANPSCSMEYECYEGMRIRIATGTISGPSQYFGSDPVAEMHITPTGARAFREKGLEYPGDPMHPSVPVWDGNPEVFELDPDKLGLPNESWVPGTTFTAIGVLGYEFSGYEIWPTELRALRMAPPLPHPVRGRAEKEVSVASLNMLNFDRDASSYGTKRDKLSQYILEVLRAPDIIGVQEVYSLASLEGLALEIQRDDPNVRYSSYLEVGNRDPGINVAFLVRSGVTVQAVTQYGKSETYLNPSTNMQDLLHDRPPLRLDASVGGSNFSVVVVHNRSLISVNTERVQAKRLAQAQSVARLAQSLQDRALVIVGDFNAFQFTDGYVDVIGQIMGNVTASENVSSGPDLVDPNLTNLIDRVPADQRYSYSFRNNAQVLDHALVNARMLPNVVGMRYARGNVDAPEREENNIDSPLAASDHDGFVVWLKAPGRVEDGGGGGGGGGGGVTPPGAAQADLGLSVAGPFVADGRARFTVTVRNAGPGSARGVLVSSALSGTGNAAGVSTSGCEEDPDGLARCTLGDLAADGSASFTIDVPSAGAGRPSLGYTGAVKSDTPDPRPGNDTVTTTLPLGPPAAPTDLVAAARSGTEIELRWKDNSSTETGFAVYQQGPGDSKLRLIGTAAANSRSTKVTGLVPNVTYNFAVEARNGQLRSERTPTATATTWAEANLSVHAEGRVVSEELARFTVSVRNAGPDDASTVVVTSSLMAAGGSFATSTTGCREDPSGVPACGLGGIEAGESESFTIDVEIDAASRNSLTYSGAAGDIADPRPQDDTVETILPLGRPAPPSHLEATAVSGMEVELRWRDNSDRETGFGVFLQGPGDSKLRMIGTAPANATSAVVNELVPDVTYSFAVEALNGLLPSERTPESTATTWTVDAARCGDDDSLCVGAFQVEVEWDDGKGRVGRGFAERLTADAGDFWFFDPANIELVVKVLDGCAINDRYWVYAAGLTDVEVAMTVRDLRSGVEKSWTNPLGTRFRPIADASAFATCGNGSSVRSRSVSVLSGAPRGPGEARYAASLNTAGVAGSAGGACAAGEATLCLLDSRFEVRADWEVDGRSGIATAVPRTTDTGMFWFFTADNVELVVKVLDGCRETGHRWVLIGGLTDVGVEVTVTDSESGRARMYRNLEGTHFPAMFDVTAFACDAGQ